MKLGSNSVEFHPQRSHNRHPMDGALAGAGSLCRHGLHENRKKPKPKQRSRGQVSFVNFVRQLVWGSSSRRDGRSQI